MSCSRQICFSSLCRVTNSTMAKSRPFILSIVLPILLIFIALLLLHKQRQLSSSLRIELDQLNSRVSVLESIIEKSDHEWRGKEDDIAEIKKMILEKEERTASLQNKIDSTDQEWLPVLKNHLFTFISNLKPYFGFVTAKTTEAYHVSKNTSVSFVVKIQRLATPFIQELYKFAKPYINQVASVTKIYLGKALLSLGTLFKKISMWFLTGLKKRLKDLIQWCLEVA